MHIICTSMYVHVHVYLQCIQWSLSNQDTLGTEESVLFSGVLISGVVMYTNRVFGTVKRVLLIKVSSL